MCQQVVGRLLTEDTELAVRTSLPDDADMLLRQLAFQSRVFGLLYDPTQHTDMIKCGHGSVLPVPIQSSLRVHAMCAASWRDTWSRRIHFQYVVF